MPLDKTVPIRRPRIEKAPDAAKRTEAHKQSTTRADDTPLSPALVKFIHVLAAAAVRASMKKHGGGS
jgi:hypothetical protein